MHDLFREVEMDLNQHQPVHATIRKAYKIVGWIWLAAVLMFFGFWGTVAYVAFHFIVKYWS